MTAHIDTERAEWLASLKVGDEAAVDVGFGRRWLRYVVMRRSPSQIIASVDGHRGNESRFRVRDGVIVGGGSGRGRKLQPMTDAIRVDVWRQRAEVALRYFNWERATDEQLRATWHVCFPDQPAPPAPEAKP